MNKIQQQQKILEQLRTEASVERRLVSECLTDILSYCQKHQEKDVLVRGFSSQGDNPFKDKGLCTIS